MVSMVIKFVIMAQIKFEYVNIAQYNLKEKDIYYDIYHIEEKDDANN